MQMLTEIRNAIAKLARQCHGEERPECPRLDELAPPRHTATH